MKIRGGVLLLGLWFMLGCSSSGGGGGGSAGGAGSSASAGASGSADSSVVGGSSGALTSAGAPGHAGATASAGAPAGDPPFISDPDNAYTSAIQVAGGYVYWLSGTHKLARAAVDGSGAKFVFSHAQKDANTIAIGGFALDADNIYFTDSGDGAAGTRGVYKIALDGSGTPSKLADGTNPFGIAIDGDTLCFTDGADLRQVKTTGGEVTTLVRGAVDYRTKLVISKNYVYFPSDFEGAASAEDLYRWPLGVAAPPDGSAGAGGSSAGAGGSSAGTGGSSAGAGGSSAPMGSSPQKISTVSGTAEILLATRTDAESVYWVAGGSAYKWSDSANAASEVAVVTEPNISPPRYVLLAYDNTLYWVGSATSIFSSSGAIYSQRLPSGTRTTVSTLQPDSLAADDKYLYGTVGKGIARIPR